jgi:hypothetical protein
MSGPGGGGIIYNFSLGSETGDLSLTSRYKRSMPVNFKSIYICQGDIGFFSYKKKTYGMFITFVNTYSTHVFACPISNTK